MSFVVDASVAAAWVLPDEKRADADLLLDRALSDGVFAPFHWPAEIANLLVMAARRGRILDSERIEAQLLLVRLAPTIDTAGAAALCVAAASISAAHQLSVYDGLYIELALRLSLPLATFDKRLAAGAQSMGVPLLTAARFA